MSEGADAPETKLPPGLVKDEDGRMIQVKSISVLEEMDLIEAAGNPTPPDRWMAIATIAATIRTIDGVPCPYPTTRPLIRAQVERAGAKGLRAATTYLYETDQISNGAKAMADGQQMDATKN